MTLCDVGCLCQCFPIVAKVCIVIYLQQPWKFCGCFVIIKNTRNYLIKTDRKNEGAEEKPVKRY